MSSVAEMIELKYPSFYCYVFAMHVTHYMLITVKTCLCFVLVKYNRKWWTETEVKSPDNSSSAVQRRQRIHGVRLLRKVIKDSVSPRRAAIPHTPSAAVLFFIHVGLPSQPFEWQVRLSTLWTLSGYWKNSLNWSSVITCRLAESVGKWKQGVALLWMNKELFRGKGVEPDLKCIIQ